MPTLPSGRRIEFSLDRFHTLLRQMDRRKAQAVAASLAKPDDLLYVMDIVYFGREDGEPFFAGCLAADWASYAADWNASDREALLAWFASAEAREARAEAIDYVRTLLLDRPSGAVAYPYIVLARSDRLGAVEAPRLLQ